MRPTPEELEEVKGDFVRISDANVELFLKKHSIYGPGNINRNGKAGVIMRIEDNLERLKSAISRDAKVFSAEEAATLDAHEEDAWRDIAVFGNIGSMLLKGEWPK